MVRKAIILIPILSKCPDLHKEHTAKLQLFVKTRYPKTKFMHAVGPEYIAICDRIEKGLHHDAEGNPDEFYMQAHTSFFDARVIVGDLRDVYVAKYVQKIPLKTELLETTIGDDRTYVSWVYAEVTIDEFCERLANAPPVHRTVTKDERRKHMDNELEASAGDDIYKIEMWLNDECEVLEGDRFFGFSSPQLTWDIGHGLRGFLHVRNKKIIEIIYTVCD